MIFLDISRSKACLGAALAKDLIPPEHKRHRILSISKRFEHLWVYCECGARIETTTTPEISELLNSSLGALETDLYDLEMEALCLAVHKQHPRHVPILASPSGTVRCSCGEELTIDGALVIEPKKEELIRTVNLSAGDSSALSFYALLFEHLLIKHKKVELIRWWASDGLNGPIIRAETKRGVEDIDDRLLYSLALKIPEFKGESVLFPAQYEKAVIGFRDLRLQHHYEHHVTEFGVDVYGTNHVRITCSCGFKAIRESKKMAKLIRQLLEPAAASSDK